MNWELDPEAMWLYILAGVLSTAAFLMLFRESRERKRAMDEAKKELDEAKKAEKPKKKKSEG